MTENVPGEWTSHLRAEIAAAGRTARWIRRGLMLGLTTPVAALAILRLPEALRADMRKSP